jgi:hypothetical protein
VSSKSVWINKWHILAIQKGRAPNESEIVGNQSYVLLYLARYTVLSRAGN